MRGCFDFRAGKLIGVLESNSVKCNWIVIGRLKFQFVSHNIFQNLTTQVEGESK